MAKEFLGVGWKFPVRLNHAGEFELSKYDSTNLSLMQTEVENALKLYEPRIDVEKVTATPQDESLVLIEIDYIVRSTNSRRNIVYPFYLKEGG